MGDRYQFQQYAANHLNTPVYVPDVQSEQAQPFLIAEQSTRHLMGWAHGLTNQHGEKLHIQMGYLERMTPNALADRYKGVHFLAMNQALLVSVMEFALFSFTQKSVFPDIGNASGEDSPVMEAGAAPGLLLLKRTLADQPISIDTDRWCVPKDEHRHVAAIYLAMLMARYVWMHELAHCTNGHIGYVQDAGLALRLYEVAENLAVVGFKEASNEQCDKDQILQALEFDADSSAFFGCCQIQLQNLENIDGIKALDLEARLGMTIFAAYATTWLFEEYQQYIGSAGNQSHPHPYDRLQNLAHVAQRDFTPQVTGFEEFHQSICDQFNSMTISNLHSVGDLNFMTSAGKLESELMQPKLNDYRFLSI
ncbi:MAG: hypothetical protein OIF58_02900 [Cohaesibacter sp.]|nr:hypothetical protein [Cohaesibacter sp.]